VRAALTWLRARADNVAAALLAVIFGAFLLQIVSRYVFNNPIGWTLEVCLTAWLWLVFWSSAFVLDDRDQVKFDVIYHWAGSRTRRVFALVSAVAMFAGFAASLPATIDYITFYKIKKSATLGIRFDIVFSVYGFFAVAMIIRSLARIWFLARGGHPDNHHPEVPTA
jgi:C4-dicarboxylate transporter, DctQ subunit